MPRDNYSSNDVLTSHWPICSIGSSKEHNKSMEFLYQKTESWRRRQKEVFFFSFSLFFSFFHLKNPEKADVDRHEERKGALSLTEVDGRQPIYICSGSLLSECQHPSSDLWEKLGVERLPAERWEDWALCFQCGNVRTLIARFPQPCCVVSSSWQIWNAFDLCKDVPGLCLLGINVKLCPFKGSCL